MIDESVKDTVHLSESLKCEVEKPFEGKMKRLVQVNIRPNGDESRIDVNRDEDGKKIKVTHTVRSKGQITHKHKK